MTLEEAVTVDEVKMTDVVVKKETMKTETAEEVYEDCTPSVIKDIGTITVFFRGRGFGFIKPEKEGEEEIMVRWEDVVTDDPFPYIKKGTEVEYVSAKGDYGKRMAKEVTLKGGMKIPLFTKPNDREVNNEITYKGTVEVYKVWKGYGFIKPDVEITWKELTSSDGLFFSKVAVVSATPRKRGFRFKLQKGTRISFKVYKDKKGLGACEVKNEDETPIEQESKETRVKKFEEEQSKKRKLAEANAEMNPPKRVKTKEELIKERQIDEDMKVYCGKVRRYRPKKGFGFIMPDHPIEFKGLNTQKPGVFVRKEDIWCDSEEVGLKKGIGAYGIRNFDDTAIIYVPEKKVDLKEIEPKTEPSKEILPE